MNECELYLSNGFAKDKCHDAKEKVIVRRTLLENINLFLGEGGVPVHLNYRIRVQIEAQKRL